MVDPSNRFAVRNGGSLPKKYLTKDNNVGKLAPTGWGACRSLHNSLPHYVPQRFFILRQYPSNEHEPGLTDELKTFFPMCSLLLEQQAMKIGPFQIFSPKRNGG
jgi:hypothetical protein